MGGFMRIEGFRLCRGVMLGASLLALSCGGTMAETAAAQTPAAQSATVQTPRVPARITQVVDEGNLVMLHGNVHRLARAEFDRGAVADSQRANRMVLLLQRSQEQETALRQLLDEQQSKASKNYHAWLTPDQFGKQFGPADTDIQAVTDWLTSRGFTGIKVGAGRTTIEFSGSVGQVRSAFHTEIHHFMVNGKAHMASVSDPQIPAALAPVVAGVVSLHDFRPKAHTHRLGTFRRTKATGEVKPLFTFAGCGSSPCYAVGPGDFAKIYNVPYVPSTMDGTGVTIAIVQDSNLNVADVQAYRSLFGLSNNFSSSNVILNGPDPGIQGPDSVTDDELEADLDVQLAGGVAPGATIDVVVSEDSQSIGVSGIDLSAIYIIDNNLAPIMSESFGACEPSLTATGEKFYNDLWEQASAQGITVILSSGDSGPDSCDQGADFATTGLSVSGLASTPFNVAIGGTDFQNFVNGTPSTFWNPAGPATTSAISYIPESTWNDSCAATAAVGTLTTCDATIINNDSGTGIDLVAAGGGPSSLNAKPSWQTGIAGNPVDGFRDVPDISLFAGNGIQASFWIVCNMDSNSLTGGSTSSCDLNSPFSDFQGVGGTSAGAPAFAGVMALINQKTGQRQGNANYVLYQLYKKNVAGTICASSAAPAASCIFYDTVAGNISVACQGGTPNCSNTGTAANQFGVLVADPTKPTTTSPAWTTAAGYDTATGLGSLNVANLVTVWSTATFTADTVAITSTTPTPVNIAHGASASFVVNVTSGSGTPTGTVSLIAEPAGNPQVGIGTFSGSGSFTLTNGSVTIATDLLPGGTNYPVIASYAGDGTFAPGQSTPVNVTVTPEASKTVVSAVTFDSSQNPTVHSGAISLAYGSSYILRVDVTDSGGDQCSAVVVACPTGKVTLTDNGKALNDFSGGSSATLNSAGIVEDQPVQLPIGTNSLVATYTGDNSYLLSTSPADVVTITSAPTTIAVVPSATAVLVGQNVTLTATIGTQSSGVGPTGTVTFSAGGTTLGTAPVVPTSASGLNGPNPVPAGGTATLQTSFTTAGAKSITARYTTGDTNYANSGPSTATTVTVTTGSLATTTTVTSTAMSIASGGSVTLTATVTAGTNSGAGVTGTVQFMNGSTALGTAATCTPTAGTSTTPGICTATLMTTLSFLTPPVGAPRHIPNMPLGPMWIVASLLLIVFLLSRKHLPMAKRLGYACAGVLLFACVAAGIAGCGGGSSSGGGTTPHTDSITAVYNGDANYAGSTSAAVAISVH
jgi:hypothetical protein